MNIEYLAQHILCSYEDKIQCMETVNNLLYITEVARREGLLALEKEVNKMESGSHPMELLNIAVRLIVDGRDPELVEKILENYLLTSGLERKALLEAILVVNASLSMQRGRSPYEIKEQLCSYFGLDFRKTFLKYCTLRDLDEKENEWHSEEYDLEDRRYQDTSMLDEVTSCLSDHATQRILRDTEAEVLVLALLGSGKKVRTKFFKNLSVRIQRLIEKEIKTKNTTEEDIRKAQQTLLDTINKLETEGEIVLFKDNTNIDKRLSENEINALLNKEKEGQENR